MRELTAYYLRASPAAAHTGLSETPRLHARTACRVRVCTHTITPHTSVHAASHKRRARPAGPANSPRSVQRQRLARAVA